MKKLSNKAKRALAKVLFFVVGGSMILISIINRGPVVPMEIFYGVYALEFLYHWRNKPRPNSNDGWETGYDMFMGMGYLVNIVGPFLLIMVQSPKWVPVPAGVIIGWIVSVIQFARLASEN